MTGMIPSRHGVQDWIRGGNLNKKDLGTLAASPCFRDESKAIPYLDGMTGYTDILAANGYQCALSGKWHLGDSLHPQHGFTRWFTIGRGGCTYYNGDLVENGKVYFEPRYITDVITDKALEFMDDLYESEDPYYLSVHYTAPHSPWDQENHPAEYWDLYENCSFGATPDLPLHPNQISTAPCGTGKVRKELLRGYYAAISAMDANIGRILQKLREQGEEENTLLIFSADNGMNMGHHGIWGKGNGTFPFNMFDTAVKVPLLIAQPGAIPSGIVEQGMHCQYDFIFTLLDYLNIPYQLPDILPGKSFAPVLRGESMTRDDEVVIFDEYGSTRMIRNQEWKYIHRYPYGPHELYHLAEDPDENNNLIEDPAYEEIRCSLRAQLAEWFYRYADPRVDGSREGVTGYGQLCRPGTFAQGKEPFYVQNSGAEYGK